MRTLVIAVVVVALLVAAYALRGGPVAVKVPGGPDTVAVSVEEGIDWPAILSIIAGALTTLEIAIRTILQLLAKRRATPTPDTPSDPMTPKPPDGST